MTCSMDWGLTVDPASWAAGPFVWIETGCIRANEGVACDEADYSGRRLSGAA